MIYIEINGFQVKRIIVSPDKDSDPELEAEFNALTLAPVKAYAKLLDEALTRLARQTWDYVKEALPERLEEMEKMERDYYGKTVAELMEEENGNQDSQL